VRDRVFSGADVDEALAHAGATLGLPRASLRYVVLEPGTAGGRGLTPTPARVAVLLPERAGAGEPRRPEGEPTPAPADPRAGVRATLRALAAAGELDVDAEVEDAGQAVLVRLSGPDASFFLGPDGRGEVLGATEHLLQRLYGAALQPRALRLTGEGFRERRDEALAEGARRLAEAVRADGQPRTMPALNAYERRVVHVALQGEPGVTTYSVGQGTQRRLIVGPTGQGPGGPEGRDGDQ
jgi:spoIIIJ-associated protein